MTRAIFSRPPPELVVRHLLAGPNAPADLVAKVRAAVARVRPEILSARAQIPYADD